MNYNEITKAIKNRLEYVPAASQELQDDLIMGGYQTESDFEDIMCEYVDAMDCIKGLDSRKKQIIGYKAMGYFNWMIAEKLKCSERTVERDLAYLNRRLK